MKIGVAGCAGRMGQMLMEAVREHGACTLSVTSAKAEELDHVHTYLQREALHQVMLTDKVETLAHACDAVIDFTAPSYSLDIAQACAQQGTAHICGTTGFTEDAFAQLTAHAQHMPLIWAANFSVGVNLLARLTQQVAQTLDDAYDIEITETHHRYKKDAPSGTALALGRAAAQGRGVAMADVAEFGRNGITGEREKGAIGFHALRGGDVVGDHTVLFAGMGERIELSHLSSSRRIYADGALRCALWTQGKKAGLYTMDDVLFGGKS